MLAFGSNKFDDHHSAVKIIANSLTSIAQNLGFVQALSKFYKTPAFPAGSGPDFVNAAAVLQTNYPSAALLHELHDVEAGLGRERMRRWGARTLDIDLIACGDQIRPSAAVHERWRTLDLESQMREAPSELILPHPRLQDRAFVLLPLCDIAPAWRHPVLGQTVKEMLDSLPASALSGIEVLDLDPEIQVGQLGN
ncbi:2-amino-4-hydroxy-6-hydroxymethyldihydropteridine diphosphokinase [Palleronia caenipelagi]|uniref:2-amino-4-hydroxy-6- hydroxymethyldihydropteridine diphosphokinase n=1 Tax=Palleronia caenipelagi TaxID=2489174 RepID=UPI00163D6882|nr:2-amino-4-hydroxy-6-hydroxymethyldihydropteridine diphosphokinase [Palleronia caenipelagi]